MWACPTVLCIYHGVAILIFPFLGYKWAKALVGQDPSNWLLYDITDTKRQLCHPCGFESREWRNTPSWHQQCIKVYRFGMLVIVSKPFNIECLERSFLMADNQKCSCTTGTFWFSDILSKVFLSLTFFFFSFLYSWYYCLCNDRIQWKYVHVKRSPTSCQSRMIVYRGTVL